MKIPSSRNPAMATSKNPFVATSLNPRVATSLNPNVVSNIDGLFVWDLALSAVGSTVKANDRVDLIFAPDAEFCGLLIAAREGFRNESDLDNEWCGHWLQARDNSWLRYGLDGEWQGFTT